MKDLRRIDSGRNHELVSAGTKQLVNSRHEAQGKNANYISPVLSSSS